MTAPNLPTPTKPSDFNLHEAAILFRKSFHMAGITARSKTGTSTIASTHKANPERVAGIVKLLSKIDLAPLTAIVNEVNDFVKLNTLPWEDTGWRLLPVSRYSHVKRILSEKQDAFNDQVATMVANYAQLRKDYVQSVPGILSQEVPFPTEAQFKSNFGFELFEQVIPDVSDIRLRHVDPKTVEALKASINDGYAARMAEAQRDIIARLAEAVARVKKQTADEKGRLFHTLVSNIEEMVDVLPNLNLANDPEINRLITRVRTELTSLDVETLRTDPKLRKQTAKLADSILSDLNNYGKVTPLVSAAKPVAPEVAAVVAPVSKSTTVGRSLVNAKF